MNEKTLQTILDSMADKIRDLELHIESKDWRIKDLEQQLEDLRNKLLRAQDE